MKLESSAIPADSAIDLKHADQGAGGRNVSPDLRWSDLPEGTLSLCVTVYDPDAPTGSGWWHWLATDIPATLNGLDEGARLPESARQWVNDYGYHGYGGPCPPPGPAHRYVHTVHAMPMERLPVPDQATSAQVRFTILANQLDQASFTGTFAIEG